MRWRNFALLPDAKELDNLPLRWRGRLRQFFGQCREEGFIRIKKDRAEVYFIMGRRKIILWEMGGAEHTTY